ncbi:MAG: helix-turn-helix domain-containing protein [Actinomycetota bacterium]|nr:helix-turn-helix domain-containing protein [Actinomycetota bacterium]
MPSPADDPIPGERRALDDGDRHALEVALERVGDRWSMLIVAALLGGPARFGELLDQLPGLSPNILSARLKHLEAAGMLVARPYSERPARFSYGLTSAGSGLAEVVDALVDWGRRLEPGAHAAAAGHLAEHLEGPDRHLGEDDVRFL